MCFERKRWVEFAFFISFDVFLNVFVYGICILISFDVLHLMCFWAMACGLCLMLFELFVVFFSLCLSVCLSVSVSLSLSLSGDVWLGSCVAARVWLLVGWLGLVPFHYVCCVCFLLEFDDGTRGACAPPNPFFLALWRVQYCCSTIFDVGVRSSFGARI